MDVSAMLVGAASCLAIILVLWLYKKLLEDWIAHLASKTIDDSSTIWQLTKAIENHDKHIKAIEDSLNEEE